MNYKSIEKFLVEDQFVATQLKERSKIRYFAVVHFPQERTDQSTIIGEILPHNVTANVFQGELCLIPDFQVEAIEEVLLFSVEEQLIPTFIFPLYLVQFVDK